MQSSADCEIAANGFIGKKADEGDSGVSMVSFENNDGELMKCLTWSDEDKKKTSIHRDFVDLGLGGIGKSCNNFAYVFKNNEILVSRGLKLPKDPSRPLISTEKIGRLYLHPKNKE